MGPKKNASTCQVCAVQTSKYRCSACPLRYCSVTCYKIHKQNSCDSSTSSAATLSAPAPSLEPESVVIDTGASVEPNGECLSNQTGDDGAESPTLRALTSLRWPPEPELSIFTDPLMRDDPKPLRHSELERIATSVPLRTILRETDITKVLTALDSLPSAHARHAALSRLLGIDAESLSKPAASALLTRDSPPPLDELLVGETSKVGGNSNDWGAEGWWLGREGTPGGRVWIGPEERRVMRLWAGTVVGAIDADVDGEKAGRGGLAWEL